MKRLCFHCAAECREEDYCYGCKTHICRECCVNIDPCGSHPPEDHLTPMNAKLSDCD